MKRSLHVLLLAAMALLGLARSAAADRIVTKDGKTFDGKILEETKAEIRIEVKVRGLSATQTFKRDEIASVIHGDIAPAAAPDGAGPVSRASDPAPSVNMSAATAAERMLRAFAARKLADAIEVFHAFDGARRREGAPVNAEAERRALAEAATRLKLDLAALGIDGRDLAGVLVVAAVRLAHRCEDCEGKGGASCAACEGTGSARCPACNGLKSYACGTCGGARFTKCPSCLGVNARKMCTACNGQGRIYRPGSDPGPGKIVVIPPRWDDCVACEKTGFISCKTCAGKGALPCGACASSGRAVCHTCGGTGRSRGGCAACSGRGFMPCGACGGSGERAKPVAAASAPPVQGDFYSDKLNALEAAASHVTGPGAVSMNEVISRRHALARLRAIRDAGLLDQAEYERRASAAVEGR
jgi:hypothetical protein